MWTEQGDGGVVTADSGQLTAFIDSVCRQMGADPDVAAAVAGHLVGANAAGHDSHGVLRLGQYVAELDRGDLAPAARPSVLRRRGACHLVDGHRGFGHFTARYASELAMAEAAETGLAAVAIRQCGHIGRLGHYCEEIAAAGMVGLMVVGAVGPDIGVMALPGTSRRFLAANPWALGVPAADSPVVVDVSMSMLAEGKVSDAAARGVRLPAGCVVDAAHQPSREPGDYFAGGGLLPLGSPAAGHKGFGLALAAALLGGLATIDDDNPVLAGTQRPPWSTGEAEMSGVFLVVIDPEAFGGRTAYRESVGDVARHIAKVEVDDGATVTVPGEPENRSRALRTGGFDLPSAVAAQLADIGARFGIPFRPA
ncbi:Ldh family oxidoreductase [Streptomyces sp. NPDC059918]|uniref:Ldh family oxidoreductase n=1 Tax=unclassified Streptomyces TaxID=2593676 RepID=UPI00365AACFF